MFDMNENIVARKFPTQKFWNEINANYGTCNLVLSHTSTCSDFHTDDRALQCSQYLFILMLFSLQVVECEGEGGV